jgi:hypothetical protein
MPTKEHDDDPHVSCSFSIPKSIKDKMDRRIARLSITRSDYIKWIVLWELDKGEDAVFDMPRKPRPAEDFVPDSVELKRRHGRKEKQD